jgi:hypothetical protein
MSTTFSLAKPAKIARKIAIFCIEMGSSWRSLRLCERKSSS